MSGSGRAHPALVTVLATLVNQPLRAADPPDPAARAAALLGARAAGFLDEEVLRAQFLPFVPSTVEPKEVIS